MIRPNDLISKDTQIDGAGGEMLHANVEYGAWSVKWRDKVASVGEGEEIAISGPFIGSLDSPDVVLIDKDSNGRKFERALRLAEELGGWDYVKLDNEY